MVKKRKSTGISDMLFEDVDPYGAVLGQPVIRPAEHFPLNAIIPDPEQPRRLLPTDLATAVRADDLEPPAAMREWLRRAGSETGSPLAQEVRELRRLAAAIEQHGLINPITIRPAAEEDDDRYIIVTGERRYWAHVLLMVENRQIREGEAVQAPDQIKAALVPPGVSIRAHQIVENLMREDINVLEKARGLNALRQELSDDAYRRRLEEDSEAKPKLVPWTQVEKALDMSRQYRARIVSVLDLSEEAQELVDRYNLAEATIRPVVEKLRPFPSLQVQALQQLIAWQDAEARGEGGGRRIVPSVRALVDRMLAKKESSKEAGTPAAAIDFSKFRQKVRGTLRYMRKLDRAAYTEFSRILENDTGGDIVDELQALRDQIDEMLAALADDALEI